MLSIKPSLLKSFIGACLIIAGGDFATLAQQPAPRAPAGADAAQDPAKLAFEALPEGDRKAVQDGLIWTGDYKGIADGRFGKGTRDAIVAFALRTKLPGDGTLDDKGRALLAAAALRGRNAVRFSLVKDDRSGIRIGVPLKLLPKISAVKSGTRYAANDGAAMLEMATVPESGTSLEQRFEALKAEAPQRKITYKVLRPDFFVVVGETAGTIFYTRMTRGERGGEKLLANYTLTYPASAKATYDMIAIAVANSFEPFAAAPSLAAAPSPADLKGDQAAVAKPPGTGQPGGSETPPNKAYLAANGLVVGNGLVVTSLPAAACRDPQIAAHSVKIAQQDKAAGLTLLEAANISGPAPALQSGELKIDMPVVTLGYAARPAPAAGRDGVTADDLVAAPGMLRPGTGGLRVFAATEGVTAGSPVFDRSGALIGLLAAGSGTEKRAGPVSPQVSPMANRPMIDGKVLAGFLAGRHVKDRALSAAPERTVGDIVAENRSALVAVYCAP